MKRILSLPHLPAFEAAARLSSFSAAANELCLTTGAISRHVRSLEKQMNVSLFYRSHKSVRLTRAGEEFAIVASRVINELHVAENKLRESVSRPFLTVQSLPTLAMHWLMPMLAQFNEQHPEMTVDVTTGMGVVNRNAHFDVAIRRDPAHFAGLQAFPFLYEKSVMVCSSEYLQNRPVLAPDELEGHITIHIRAREDLWQYWLDSCAARMSSENQRITLDHTFAAIQAAEDGLGLAVIPYLFCAKHLSSGRLVSPFPETAVHTGSYSLLLRDTNDDVVMTFATWLKTFLSNQDYCGGATQATERSNGKILQQ